MEIDSNIEQQIKEICDEGDVLIEMKEYTDAFNNFIQALNLVPEPKDQYPTTVNIMAGLGDVCFQTESYEQAKQVLSDAMHCVGGIGNPFLHLRLGQCQFELGNEESAVDELTRAYKSAGKELFDNEDPKYFSFLKTKIEPPE